MSRVAAGLDVAIIIDAPPGRVLKAFFEHEALSAWWQVAHSVTTPRALGPYAVEWVPTDFRDEILGRLGGVFRGTVVKCLVGEGFVVADAFWLPPDGEPIGPMALDVWLRAEPDAPHACTSCRAASKRRRAGAATTKSSVSAGRAPSHR